jgi:hypothetical protein
MSFQQGTSNAKKETDTGSSFGAHRLPSRNSEVVPGILQDARDHIHFGSCCLRSATCSAEFALFIWDKLAQRGMFSPGS